MYKWSNINLIYLYDGTFEGFLSTVSHILETKQIPFNIESESITVHSIISDTFPIQTDFSKSSKIFDRLFNISEYVLYYINNVFLSHHQDKEVLLLKYIIYSFKYGSNINTMLTIPEVLRVQKISKAFMLEVQKLKGFLRFSEIMPNMFIAEIEPDNNIIEFLCAHFKKRLPTQNWIIYDKKRRLAGIYNMKKYIIVSSNNLIIPEISDKEKEFQDLWKMFFKNIAIKERTNPKLQKQYMPKRYWKYILETEKY